MRPYAFAITKHGGVYNNDTSKFIFLSYSLRVSQSLFLYLTAADVACWLAVKSCLFSI